MTLERRRFEFGSNGGGAFSDYWALVHGEKWRSERHNRFFVVFGVVATGIEADELVRLLQSVLRASDYVFLLEDPGDQVPLFSLKMGILLPETDLPGAEVVKQRLDQVLRTRGIQLHLGQAVYPDDATVPEELLAVAFNTALTMGLLPKPIRAETLT